MCNSAELKIAEYHNIRVLTTQQLACSYGTDTKTISNNFNRNKDRYIEGKHYICLENEEKRIFIDHHQFDDSSKKAVKLYLWTEKGAFLHAKSLNTDEAWEVYDRLVENYFRVKHGVIDRSQLSPQMQMLYAMMDEQAKQELEQQKIKEKQEKIEKKLDVVVATYEKNDSSDDFKQWCKNCAGKIAKSPKLESLSSREVYAVIWNESYQRLTEKRPCNLKTRLTNERGKAFERGKSSSWIKQHITYLSIIADDKDLKPAYESVMREMMMVYCAE